MNNKATEKKTNLHVRDKVEKKEICNIFAWSWNKYRRKTIVEFDHSFFLENRRIYFNNFFYKNSAFRSI